MGNDYSAAYAAGILDGEGSISMTRVGGLKHKTPYWRIVVAVSNCDLLLIEFMYSHWNGAKLIGMDKGPTRRPQHRWTVVGNNARAFLTDVRPFLIIKAERADWAREALDLQNRARKPYEAFPDGVKERLAEIRTLFDSDRSRSLSARGRIWNGR